MSVTLTKAETDTCARDACEVEFAIPNAAQGSYCSGECADRDDAASVLQHLEQAHTFCVSCFKPRKVVYRPDEASTPELRKKAFIIRESFVGFETLTEFSEAGPYGIECSCGAINHDLAVDLCRDGEPYEWFLQLAIDHFRELGEWDYEFDIEEFCEVFWRSDDFELAIGRALRS